MSLKPQQQQSSRRIAFVKQASHEKGTSRSTVVQSTELRPRRSMDFSRIIDFSRKPSWTDGCCWPTRFGYTAVPKLLLRSPVFTRNFTKRPCCRWDCVGRRIIVKRMALSVAAARFCIASERHVRTLSSSLITNFLLMIDVDCSQSRPWTSTKYKIVDIVHPTSSRVSVRL